MADQQLKRKIRDTLKAGYFADPDDLVDISDGPDDSVHVVSSVANSMAVE